MILIAHRGNINGPDPDLENSPIYLLCAIKDGYYVETDVWKTGTNTVSLGHDNPCYDIDLDFLQNPKIICHAKTPETLQLLLQHNIHCFYHDIDDCVLTSQNYIWTYPGKSLTSNSICVMPEFCYPKLENMPDLDCFGICTDFVAKLKMKN